MAPPASNLPPRPHAASRAATLAATLRSIPWAAEAAGAVGDLGTFLPLTLGLVAAAGLDLGTTLVGTGLYNLASGALFGVPMPVQPMKAIAAAAIAAAPGPAGLPAIMAAGMRWWCTTSTAMPPRWWWRARRRCGSWRGRPMGGGWRSSSGWMRRCRTGSG